MAGERGPSRGIDTTPIDDGERHRMMVSGFGIAVPVDVTVTGSAVAAGDADKSSAISNLIRSKLAAPSGAGGKDALRLLESVVKDAPLTLTTLHLD